MSERAELGVGGAAAAAWTEPVAGQSAASGGSAGDGVAAKVVGEERDDTAPGAGEASDSGDIVASRVGDGSSGDAAAPPPLREDLTLLVTVLLGTPGEELAVVVGARCGERPHARFAQLTLPRAGWVEALFGKREPGAAGGDPVAVLTTYIADVGAAQAERQARSVAARPTNGPASKKKAGGGNRAQGTSTPPLARPADGAAAAGGGEATATGGMAALLAQRKATQSTAIGKGTPPPRRSLFDLDDLA